MFLIKLYIVCLFIVLLMNWVVDIFLFLFMNGWYIFDYYKEWMCSDWFEGYVINLNDVIIVYFFIECLWGGRGGEKFL